MKTPNFVAQYHGEIRIFNGERITTVTLVGSDLHEAKEIVGRMLGDPRADFRSDMKAACTLVFHPSYQRGQNPVGWISELELPGPMSLQAKGITAAA